MCYCQIGILSASYNIEKGGVGNIALISGICCAVSCKAYCPHNFCLDYSCSLSLKAIVTEKQKPINAKINACVRVIFDQAL